MDPTNKDLRFECVWIVCNPMCLSVYACASCLSFSGLSVGTKVLNYFL